MHFRRITIFAALAVVLSATILPARAQTAGQPDLVVFAAASLKNALDDADMLYRQSGGAGTRESYAASSTLAKQIEAGAPADIFISADLDWMDYLAQRKLIRPATRFNLAGNTLVLIAPKDSKSDIRIAPRFALAAALGADGRLAIADPDAVPAGKYAKAALTSLGVWDAVAGRLAPAENVRATLLLVARGETPFGIVYRTDAAVEPGVRVVDTFPAGSYPTIVYPAAIVESSRNPAAAAYLAFLRSPGARAAFAAKGFQPVE